MKSKTKIKKQLKRKNNPSLVKAIKNAGKNNSWKMIAEIISRPRRKNISVNLNRIDRETRAGESVIVPGKVLSSGDVSKKIKIVALQFSGQAERKLKEAGCETAIISDEMILNPKMEKIKVIR